MKRIILCVALLCAGAVHAQSWSNILSSSRAINWTTAGLPATLPDGETTANPWTPPTRPACTTAQAGTTVPIPSGTSAATIDSAIAACFAANPNGSYLLIGGTVGSPATITLGATNLLLGNSSSGAAYHSVTLRGSGAQATKIVINSSGNIFYGNSWRTGNATWTAGFAQGATSLTMSALNSGTTPIVGEIIQLTQCDTGLSGAGCTTGTRADNGGVFLCGDSLLCGNQANQEAEQLQAVQITSITGTGPYTVNFTPGLYMQNWTATGGGSLVTWTGEASGGFPYGIGLEDVTVDMTATGLSNYPLQMAECYACWMKGVRVVGNGASGAHLWTNTAHSLIANSYYDDYSIASGSLSLSLLEAGDSDNLVINTIMLHGLSLEIGGSTEDDIFAYNYVAQSQTLYYENEPFLHVGGNAFFLMEGDEAGGLHDDATYGTSNIDTYFRNYAAGWDPPYYLASSCSSDSCHSLLDDGFHRFLNFVGNAAGSQFVTNYQGIESTPTNGIVNNTAFRWSHDVNDPLTLTTALRWGNCDTATSTCRFQSSEVPTTLSGAAIPYQNSVPANNNIPCSFFLAGYTSTAACTVLTSGGTGLSWWGVCTSQGSFPYITCSTTQKQPFPIAGPDVTSGPYVNGHAYDNPAAVAFANLPIDPYYQCHTGGAVCSSNLAITASTWSATCSGPASGTYACETLTVTGFPSGSDHIMGGFQITGASACNSAAGTEFTMTGSSESGTTATIIYALTSNPGAGACNGGTMLFPDVKQFDERVYQNDPPAGPPQNPAQPWVIIAQSVQ